MVYAYEGGGRDAWVGVKANVLDGRDRDDKAAKRE